MAAKNRLEEIVGRENVLDGPEILESYAGDLSFVPRIRPRCVVRPRNAQEVQQIVEWANETGTPLVPVSSGSPHFRGDTVPRIGGAVIVELSRMKSIMRIDAKNRVAIVEPGVTFGELQPELEKAGLSAYMPLCPKSSKSVVASMLERDPITMPAHHWDATDPYLCVEAVFGTGDVLRTSEAAGPETTEEKWAMGCSQMTPYGIAQMDENKLLSGAQGTLGIITWASMKCRMASKFSRTLLVPCDDLAPLLDLSYKLLRVRQSDHLFILNGLNLACLVGKGTQGIKALEAELPNWGLVVSFEGNGDLPEDKVAWQEADFRDMVARTGQLKVAEAAAGGRGEDLSRILSRPSEEPYWKLRYKGGCSELFFLTTLDKTSAFASAVARLSQAERISPTDIGVYIQPVVQGTSCHCEFDIFYDPSSEAETEGAKRLMSQGATDLANMGAFFSRPYGAWAKVAYARAAETAVMQRKIKKIYDPKNVLNPGQLCF